MWLFKRAKHDAEKQDKESVRTRLGKSILKLQTAFAERMNEAIAKLPARKLKIGLVIFCLVSGGFSMYLAIKGVFGGRGEGNAISIDHTSVPKHFDKSGDGIRGGQPLIEDDVYRQLKAFRIYADSLQKANLTAYDSLMGSRPGLMDSINTIEEIYLSQQIK